MAKRPKVLVFVEKIPNVLLLFAEEIPNVLVFAAKRPHVLDGEKAS